MRGKRGQHICNCWRQRNIPAYAGKTLEGKNITESLAEHPRVCGENLGKASRKAWPIGTSPRMRGKLSSRHFPAFPKGNIPAYAGKTRDHLRCPHRKKEHPRVCGENGIAAFYVVVQGGTSPRMRGKQSVGWTSKDAGGNIPAYAGKTSRRWCVAMRCGEHPRVCGENSLSWYENQSKVGTSPRMRGKPV